MWAVLYIDNRIFEFVGIFFIHIGCRTILDIFSPVAASTIAPVSNRRVSGRFISFLKSQASALGTRRP